MIGSETVGDQVAVHLYDNGTISGTITGVLKDGIRLDGRFFFFKDISGITPSIF